MMSEKDKPFDLHKGGRGNPQKFGSGHEYEEPKSPAIRVREKADKTREPLAYEEPTHRELNHFKIRKPATEAIAPRNPGEIEDNLWRNFSQGKGGINDIKDDLAGEAGVHNFEAPPEHDLDFLKGFRGRKP
jgi:hypothetical protein